MCQDNYQGIIKKYCSKCKSYYYTYDNSQQCPFCDITIIKNRFRGERLWVLI